MDKYKLYLNGKYCGILEAKWLRYMTTGAGIESVVETDDGSTIAVTYKGNDDVMTFVKVN